MIDTDLMPHQKKALRQLSTGKILKGDTGSGKTRVGMAWYAPRAPWKALYVITTALKRDSMDWQEEALRFGCEITVDSWNNMHNYDDVEGAVFIFDEQRVVGSGVWVGSFLKIVKKNDWILLSATPGDTWMDYIPVFVANGFYRNRTEFCRQHVVFSRFVKFPKVERFLDTSVLADHLRSILVVMPYKKHTKRHFTDVFCEYDRELFDVVWKKRWNYLEGRPIKNVAELFSLMRRVVNQDPSRIQRIRDLLVEHPKLIIFYNFDYELEILRGLDVTLAEHNGHRHDPVPSGDEWVYIVQYYSGAEAWNCTATDAMLFYSATYSYRSFVQAQGRIDRLDTPFKDLHYYVLRSGSIIDRAVFAVLSEKRDFNEKTAIKTMV